MPLKRIELLNFKSYKGSQIISLGDAPFTCIIGPNGAGKSNMMDAISFVLGVKSAQLRSTQLRDLVYRGRKALEVEGEAAPETQDETQESAADVGPDARSAWVMAVYEDTKGKEWKFRRNINTAGVSTYYLNNKTVQWNAYNAQLEKFNILVKAKNFLVFQGDVEGIASQDSKALSKLIDRISGSLDLEKEYTEAKELLDKATDASNSNYAKKRGMLTEVKHFKEQREEVRQWEKMRDAKDAMIQRHLLWKLYHIKEEIDKSTKEVEEANAKLTDFKSSVDKNERKHKEAKKNQAAAQNDVKKREGRVKKAEKAYEDKKPELLAVETKIIHSEKLAANASANADRVERDEQRQADSLAELESGAKAIERSIKDAADRQKKKAAQSGKALSQGDLDQYRQLRSQANTLVVAERQQLETLRREQKTLHDALASAEDKVQQAERQKENKATEVANLEEREKTMSEKVKAINKDRDEVKGQLDAAQAERQRTALKETEINERLSDTIHKLMQAGQDKKETEREIRLKETITSLKRLFPGVYGRVVDLCRPTSNKYSTAVMTVLGRNIDSVVVEQESIGIQCIEYLKSQRAGQATFIPLDTIQIKPVPERLRGFKGAKLAIDCIEYRADVERAMQHACSSTLICDSMGISRQICYDKGQEVKAVTLDGTVIHKAGLITGGQGASGGRKFNDQEVENLKALKSTYERQMNELNKARPKDLDEKLYATLARLDAEHSIAKDDLDATRLRLNGLRAELKGIEGDLKKMRPDLDKKAKAVKTAEDKLETLQDTVDAAEQGVFAAFCKKIKIANIREYEDVQLKMAKEESEAMEKYSQQQARVNHQIEFEKNQLNTTRERLVQLRATVERARGQLKTLAKEKKTVESELEALQADVDSQREKLSLANDALAEITENVSQLRDAARKAQRTLDKALKEIASWNDEIDKSASDRHAIYRRCRLEEIELPLLKGSLDKVPIEEQRTDEDAMDVDDEGTQHARKTSDYGVQPDFDVLDEEEMENNSDELNREFEGQITKLKADLEKVVPNMKAVERLEDVQANLDDAEREADQARRDSKRAKDTFQDLKNQREALFRAAFDHMSARIDQIYKGLTVTKGKGASTSGVAFMTCDLQDEPYLGGVRYTVMPPGKRYSEMEVLSGGEKTMAALALLFAIHSFHPAPFFVLDEVDAALDPTNVAKLAGYIRQQAEKDVQFLIISLKSTLYEHADGLVGVYREQEENSSRTLTLDLRKYVE